MPATAQAPAREICQANPPDNVSLGFGCVAWQDAMNRVSTVGADEKIPFACYPDFCTNTDIPATCPIQLLNDVANQ
jgi:hypothetical protein